MIRPTGQPIRVVVADDSPFLCRLLTSYLQSSDEFRVVGQAHSGAEAIEAARELRPDALTLDVEMPGMDGIEALETIMGECPTPVIMFSGVSHEAARITNTALTRGAVDFVLKYVPGFDTDPDLLRRELIDKVRAAARGIGLGFPAVTESAAGASTELTPVTYRAPRNEEPAVKRARATRPADRAIVIGGSTGAPLALRELLAQLPADLPAGVVVIQHMPEEFTSVLAAQLDRHLRLAVKEAEPGDAILQGLVLVAPGGRHLLLGSDRRIELNDGPPIHDHRPAVDVAMQSIAQSFRDRTYGVVLSGPGEDGGSGLAFIHSRYGVTFAQEPSTCVASGMAQRAVERGVVTHVAAPARIGQLLRLELMR